MMTSLYNLFVLVAAFIGLAASETTWKVTTIVEPPYVLANKSEEFKGYIPDLLNKIANETGRKFTLKLVADTKYGAKVGEKWNGMIGEVFDRTADLAAAPLTISPERQTVVDFTVPFMTFDTVVLLKKDPASAKIKSALDLINQNEIKYGVVKDGFTENFLKTSEYHVYKQLYDKMDKSNLPSTSKDGVTKVREGNGKYAFIIESSTAEYWKNQAPCDLISFRLGSWLGFHEYAFIVKRGESSIKSDLDRAFNNLRGKGELDVLRAKWWPDECSAAYHNVVSAGVLLMAALLRLLV